MTVIHETTPRSPRRQRTRVRKLEAIEEAALDIIVSEGLSALTMARLGQELDLTPGALYRYFSSKEALIVALQARGLERIAALLDARFEAAAWPRDAQARALAALLDSARFYRRLAIDEPRLFVLVSGPLGDPRTLVDEANARLVLGPMRSLFARLDAAFANAAEVRALEPGDAHTRAGVFWAAVHGVTIAAKLDRFGSDRFAPLERVDELALTLLRGWGAPTAALDAAQDHLTEIGR